MISTRCCVHSAGAIALATVLFSAGIARSDNGVATGDNVAYLNNGVIKVGVDLEMGGSITFLSTPHEANFVNNVDLGRQIQQSYYAGPLPFRPAGVEAGWDAPWNPIQSGDVYGNRSTLLEYTNNGSEIYTKSRPMQWHLNNYPGDCTLEQWTSITNNNIVTVRNRLTNARSDMTQYPFNGYGVESPAVYLNSMFPNMVTYDGTHPFTGGALTRITQPTGNVLHATENWVAYVNNYNFGVGVFQSGCNEFNATSGGSPNRGSNDPSFSYLCPVWKDVLDHNITYEYTYQLVVGNLPDIRGYAYDHRPDARPNFQFTSDRQHWLYVNASDSGWPIAGHMHVNLDQADPQMIGPFTSFQAADVPTLRIRAAFHLDSRTDPVAQLFWETDNAGGFSEARSIAFQVYNDGQYHTYDLNMAAQNGYAGLISQLRFDPILSGHAGDYMDIQYIVPEPSIMAMLVGIGLVGMSICVARRRWIRRYF